MARSTRFRQMNARCRILRKHFLPRVFSPTGAYSDRLLDAARAYRVMVHAEIESYLEDRALEVTKATLAAWKTNGKFSKTLVAMFAYAPEDVNLAGTISQRIHLIVKKYEELVVGNNGIKKHNILKMLRPIGIEEQDLDPLWLTSMETFGKQRGLVAHQSLVAQLAQHMIDPKNEFSIVQNAIMPGLEDLDQKLSTLLIV